MVVIGSYFYSFSGVVALVNQVWNIQETFSNPNHFTWLSVLCQGEQKAKSLAKLPERNLQTHLAEALRSQNSQCTGANDANTSVHNRVCIKVSALMPLLLPFL